MTARSTGARATSRMSAPRSSSTSATPPAPAAARATRSGSSSVARSRTRRAVTITTIVVWSSAVLVLLLRQFVDLGELPVLLIAVSASLVALAGTFDTARQRRRGRAPRHPRDASLL